MINKIKIEQIKEISIDNLCYETYPCKHYIKIIDNNNNTFTSSRLLSAIDIILIYKLSNIKIPKHFEYLISIFKDYILKKTYSTEIYDKEDNAIYI